MQRNCEDEDNARSTALSRTTTPTHKSNDMLTPNNCVKSSIVPASDSQNTEPSKSAILDRLLHWHELEEWQRDNEFIHTGYVPSRNSMTFVFKSLTYVHNETVNIYSHLLPGLFSIIVLVLYIQSVTTPYIIFALGCFTCLVLSASFHLLKSHSLRIAILGNKLDYLGICILIAASMLAILDISYADFPIPRFIFSTISIILGFACSYASLSDTFRSRKYRPIRAFMFVCYGLSGVLPVLYGTHRFGYAEMSKRSGLPYLYAEAFFYIFGAFLYAVRFPEKYNPGNYDLFGHSHQIFHVFVVIAAYCHFACLQAADIYRRTL